MANHGSGTVVVTFLKDGGPCATFNRGIDGNVLTGDDKIESSRFPRLALPSGQNKVVVTAVYNYAYSTLVYQLLHTKRYSLIPTFI